MTEIERIRRVIIQRERTTARIEMTYRKGIENDIVGTRIRVIHDRNIEQFIQRLAFDNYHEDSRICDELAPTKLAFIPKKLIRRITLNHQEKTEASVRADTLNRVITTCHEITAMRTMYGILLMTLVVEFSPNMHEQNRRATSMQRNRRIKYVLSHGIIITRR